MVDLQEGKKRERGCHMDRKWLLEGNNSTQYNDNRQLLFSVTTLLPILVWQDFDLASNENGNKINESNSIFHSITFLFCSNALKEISNTAVVVKGIFFLTRLRLPNVPFLTLLTLLLNLYESNLAKWKAVLNWWSRQIMSHFKIAPHQKSWSWKVAHQAAKLPNSLASS